jgi:hypoxanthine phosphoribosyltransferase
MIIMKGTRIDTVFSSTLRPKKLAMKSLMQSILITESQIHQRVRELGQQISQDYKNRDLVLLCVLKGAVVFLADLIRAISIPVRCEFIQLASYQERTESSGNVQMIQGLNGVVLSQADVLIVEDIIDTGQTLRFLLNHIEALQPASVKVCSLLDKPACRTVPITIDYIGFDLPNVFVIGYGLDYAQQYRNLPYIAVLDPCEGMFQIPEKMC